MGEKRIDQIGFGEGVDLIKMQFTDLLGQIKMVEMPCRQSARAFQEGFAINRFALGGLKR